MTHCSRFAHHKVIGVTESRLRKVLSKLNVKLGLHPHHLQEPLVLIMRMCPLIQSRHVAPDCVWMYIQQDEKCSVEIAASFRRLINA